MLKIEGLHKSFVTRSASLPVVKGLSLTVKPGTIFGFLGANGAGKTTTVKTIVGLLHPDKGRISINGLSSESQLARQAVGFMPEQPRFYRHLSALEVLLFAAGLFGIEPAEAAKRADELLAKVGLGEAKDLPAGKFSKGMHQRLAFAVALINQPKLLVMDEPLDGLDPLGRLDFKKLLLEQKKLGTTIFFSSHVLADVEEIADEVAIVHDGRIIAAGDPKQLAKGGESLEAYFVSLVRGSSATTKRGAKR